jgi:hypothetical protein
MVAAHDRQFKLPQESDWLTFKRDFLAYANFKEFGTRYFTAPFLPIPAPPPSHRRISDLLAIRNSNLKEEKITNEAWYHLTQLTSNQKAYLINDFETSGLNGKPDCKGAWENIVKHYENAAGVSQETVLRAKLANTQYEELDSELDSFGTFVNKLD